MTKYSKNTIKVFGEIDEFMAKDFISDLIDYSLDPKEDVTIIINSEGGCIYSMFAMHDCMRYVPNTIVTLGIGRVMSAATLLLAAGDKREVMPNTTIMLHEPSISDYSANRVGDMGREYAHMEQLTHRMYKLLSKYSGQPMKNLILDLNGQDFYLNAKEARHYGIIDSICKLKAFAKVDC